MKKKNVKKNIRFLLLFYIWCISNPWYRYRFGYNLWLKNDINHGGCWKCPSKSTYLPWFEYIIFQNEFFLQQLSNENHFFLQQLFKNFRLAPIWTCLKSSHPFRLQYGSDYPLRGGVDEPRFVFFSSKNSKWNQK